MSRKAFLIAMLSLLAACTPAAAAAFFGLASAAAPAVGSALGAYAQAADDAQRASHLSATDPDVIALRRELADLRAADERVEAATRPVACVEPVPVGAPLPPPAVDQAALDDALAARIAKAVAAQSALRKVRARKPKVAVVDAGVADAAGEGGT